MWKNWNPHTLLLGMQNVLCSCFAKLTIPQKDKHKSYHINQQFHSCVYTQEKYIHILYFHTEFCTRVFIAIKIN